MGPQEYIQIWIRVFQYGLRVIEYGLRVTGQWVQIGVYCDWSITRCPYLLPAEHRCFCLPPFRRLVTSLSSFHSLHLPTVSRSPSFKRRAALFTYQLSRALPALNEELLSSKAKPTIFRGTFLQLSGPRFRTSQECLNIVSIQIAHQNLPVAQAFQ